jgi:hypothetical protein
MPRDGLETEQMEYGFENAWRRGGKFDEFEAVEAHGIVKEVDHWMLLEKPVFDIMRANF